VISFLLFLFIIKLKTIHIIFKRLYILALFEYCYAVILSWLFFFIPFLKRIVPGRGHVSIESLIHQSIYSDFYNIMKDDTDYLLLEESLVDYKNANNMLPHQIIPNTNTIMPDYHIGVDANDIQLLIDTLNYFAIKVIVVKSIEGPLVNTIIVTPDKEVKLSKINSLLNDIARICGKSDLRIIYPLGDYPHSIAFEYAHHKQKTIYFFDYAYEKNFIESGPLVFLLGVNTFGIPFYLDIAKAPHVLVAGTTGSGKSNMLNLIIIELIWKNNKNTISLILIDPKKSEFFNYSIFPHLLFPIANLMSDIEVVIKNTLDIMDERYDLFQKNQCKNINEYNQKHLPLNFIVLIIDEYADIVIQSKQLESKIIRLLQMSRAAGIHVIIATQRPSADIINSIIKSNLPVRMACKVINSINSRVILDIDGAEKLLGNSDMIILINNVYSRVHGLYIDQESIEKIKHIFEHK
jgi:S-DNA-T family DNA segregation ATPase FtsK/SpoIIIE